MTNNKADPMLQFFRWEQLREGPLRETSKKFAALAVEIVATCPMTLQRSASLARLLEAKDCAVRSHVEEGAG